MNYSDTIVYNKEDLMVNYKIITLIIIINNNIY